MPVYMGEKVDKGFIVTSSLSEKSHKPGFSALRETCLNGWPMPTNGNYTGIDMGETSKNHVFLPDMAVLFLEN